MSKGENIVKLLKGQRISWLGHLERMEEDRMPKKDLHSRTGRYEKKRPGERWKEEVERDVPVLGVRRWTELVGQVGKMEGHCSAGQSPQWAVVPMEEEAPCCNTTELWITGDQGTLLNFNFVFPCITV